MGEVDLVNRDPNGLNENIQVNFDDIFGEPEGAHSADCIWQNSKKCFECGMKIRYQILTYCCAMCYALQWGCCFADITFMAIWIYTPSMRLLSIILHPTKKLLSIVLNSKLFLKWSFCFKSLFFSLKNFLTFSLHGSLYGNHWSHIC